jgi:hypothetical protein
MPAESLEVLEKADVPPAQARAIVRAIEIEIGGAQDTLATKQDLLLLRQELRQDMSNFRQEFNKDVSEDVWGVARPDGRFARLRLLLRDARGLIT